MIQIPEIQTIFSERSTQVITLAAALLLFWITAMIIKRLSNKKKKKKVLKESAEYILLQITQTPHAETQMSEMEQIRLFEDLIHSIVPEKKPIIFEIAITNEGSDIQFFIASPAPYTETIKTQVRRVFERAQAQEVPDYTIFYAKDPSILSVLTLKNFYALPIRTYRKTETDSFAPILAAFANAKEKRTGMAMQLVLQKAPKKQIAEMKKVLKGLKKGKKLKELKPTKAYEKVDHLVTKVVERGSGGKENAEPSSEAQLVEEKMQEQLYQINVRVGVSAQTQEKADLLFDNLKGRFDQFGSAGHNGLMFSNKKDRKTALDLAFRLPDEKTATIMNAQEISSIFHLLNQSIEVANLQWMKTKRVAAPTEIATEGLLLGDNVFHGQETPIYMPEKDRMRHLYVIGQTGTGKTAIVKSMAYQDIQEGRGVCIIDPHGDLVDDMLAVVPEKRLDDVIVFDPSNIEYPLALNMLEYDRSRPQEKTFIVNEILSIFYSLFDAETMGPVFEQYMRNSLLLLMEGKIDEPATLMEVPTVLTDENFRTEMLKNCHNDPVKKFWEEEAQKAGGDAALENIAPYITSKFSNFISNDYVRPIISQPYSSFSFRETMDSGKLLFVRLPKGKIGEINARLLGMIVSGKLALAAFSRDDIAEDERRPFYFFIDEFQNFTSDSIEQILSEARKYKLSLNIAHQYMAQLTDSIRGAVLGNVGTTISFRVGVEDAEILEKKFTPQFSAIELTETENLNCVVGMLSNSKPLSPFTMRIRFAPRGQKERKDQIVQYSAIKHSSKQKKPEEQKKPTESQASKTQEEPVPPKVQTSQPTAPPPPSTIPQPDTPPPPRMRGLPNDDNTAPKPPPQQRIADIMDDKTLPTKPPQIQRRPTPDERGQEISESQKTQTPPDRTRHQRDWDMSNSDDSSPVPPRRPRGVNTDRDTPTQPRPQRGRVRGDNAGITASNTDDIMPFSRRKRIGDDDSNKDEIPPPHQRRRAGNSRGDMRTTPPQHKKRPNENEDETPPPLQNPSRKRRIGRSDQSPLPQRRVPSSSIPTPPPKRKTDDDKKLPPSQRRPRPTRQHQPYRPKQNTPTSPLNPISAKPPHEVTPVEQ